MLWEKERRRELAGDIGGVPPRKADPESSPGKKIIHADP